MGKSIFLIMNYILPCLSRGRLLQLLVMNKAVRLRCQQSLNMENKSRLCSCSVPLWPGAKWGHDWWRTPGGPECQCEGTARDHSPWPVRTAGCRRRRSASTEFPRNEYWSRGWAPRRSYSRTRQEREDTMLNVVCRIVMRWLPLPLSLLPEGPVVLAVGLDKAEIETETLGDVQHVAEVQAYSVKQHGGHADLIQGPHIVTATWMVRLPPAELHAEFTSTGRELDRHDPGWERGIIRSAWRK